MKNIATVITALRKEKGWSQTDLARESAISREILGKYERGEEQLPDDEKKTVFALIDAFITDFRNKQQYTM